VLLSQKLGEHEVGRIFVALLITAALALTTYFGLAAWQASRDSDITGKISVPLHK